MSGNPTWIWARWPYPAQESSRCKVGYIAYLAVGGLLASYLHELIKIKIRRDAKFKD